MNASADKHMGKIGPIILGHYDYRAACAAAALKYHALFFSHSGNGLNGPQNALQKDRQSVGRIETSFILVQRGLHFASVAGVE